MEKTYNENKNIIIESETTETNIIEICKEYWSLNVNYDNYDIKIKDISKKNKITQSEVRNIVLNNSNAYLLCPICKGKINTILKTREDAKIKHSYTNKTIEERFCSKSCLKKYNHELKDKIWDKDNSEFKQNIENENFTNIQDNILLNLYNLIPNKNEDFTKGTFEFKKGYVSIKPLKLNISHKGKSGYSFLSDLKDKIHPFVKSGLKKEKKRMMQVIGEKRNFDLLTNTEYNTLIILSRTDDITETLNIMGINNKKKKVIENLNEKSFINTSVKDLPLFDENLKNHLNKNGFRNASLSLLSEKSLLMFKKLKEDYKYVYPRVAIKNLISENEMKRIQKKYKKNENEIKKACYGFINYLVCKDEIGNPLFAVDYREKEYYSKFPEQEEKDTKYKRILLFENGIPYHIINDKSDLKQLKKYSNIIMKINN